MRPLEIEKLSATISLEVPTTNKLNFGVTHKERYPNFGYCTISIINYY